MELLGKRDNIRATASTYLSFNRPLPPSEEYFLHRSTSTILDRCYLFTSSACPNDTEYWEIDDTIADDKKEYVLTETEGTAVLKRFNATSDLQPTFTNAAKPVCSSTPLCISSESVSILPNNNENISGYYRSLDKHVSIPKFPPPPPPVEEFKEDTMVMIDSDDFALWEIENCRTCVDSMSPDLSLCEESIILTDNEVDLNETFIEEMTFYVDRPPSEMSVLRVYSKTNPSKFEEIFFLSESIEV
ncbi:unnamed protein product [Haemonchus placei]|uniref:NAC domain-containing protein n=1 Tax=Haemonchus placei TaxID=6290 RepID=A0A0N4W0P0_HAEPC|nr:unnamed protein product [Haemonchus placei]